MTMRRGHHTSGVIKAMGAGASESETESEPAQHFEDSAASEPE
jgi:hypothetical protein